MGWPRVIEELERNGEVKMRPKGQSMTPRIKSGQKVTLTRWPNQRIGPLEVGMIVLAKVKGNHFVHKITAVDGTYPNFKRVQISNNHGHVNGWTTPDRVYAVVTKIES